MVSSTPTPPLPPSPITPYQGIPLLASIAPTLPQSLPTTLYQGMAIMVSSTPTPPLPSPTTLSQKMVQQAYSTPVVFMSLMALLPSTIIVSGEMDMVGTTIITIGLQEQMTSQLTLYSSEEAIITFSLPLPA